MTDGYGYAEPVAQQLLQVLLPGGYPTPVGAAAVRQDQQMGFAGVEVTSFFLPPSGDDGHRKRRRVMRHADHDVARILGHVIDAEGDCHALRLARKIVLLDLRRLLAPGPPGLAKVADQLLLFRIHADDRLAGLEELLPQGRDVAKLLIPARRVPRGAPPPSDGGPQREAHPLEQGPHGHAAHGEALPPQALGQLRHAAAHPLLFAVRIPCHLVAEHLLKHSLYGRVLLLDPRPPGNWLALLLQRFPFEEICELAATVRDRRAAQARNLRNCANTPSADAVRLDGRVQPALLSGQGAQKRLQLPAELLV